jgi:Ca2+-binding EF-hand superfamily protein
MRIRQIVRFIACAGAVFLIAAACAGPRRAVIGMRALPPIGETEQNIKLMLSYDENSDGVVTRQELEAGLRRQYAMADTNHDGKIDLREMQAENDRRFRAFGTEASPLIDWNQDGVIDFDEFASTARSVFDDMDKNHDMKLDQNELRLPQAGRGPIQPRPGQMGQRGGGGR